MTENISVNVHSSIRIDAGSAVIRTDPFKITGEPHDANIIFVTHEHYDHFSPDDIRKVSKPGTVFVAPESMKAKLGDFGAENTVLMKPGEKTEVLGIPVEAVAAYNSLKPFHPKSKGWLGYIVTVGGKRIYTAGDTDNVKEINEVSCDIALVPIGGTYTMNSREAAALVNAIKPVTVIPVHYGSVVGTVKDAEKFRELVDDAIKVEIRL